MKLRQANIRGGCNERFVLDEIARIPIDHCPGTNDK